MLKLRRLLATSGVALGLAGAISATAVAQGGGQEKTSVCHQTGNGMHQIEIAAPAVDAHIAHGDSVVDDYGECPGGEGVPGAEFLISVLVDFAQGILTWLETYVLDPVVGSGGGFDLGFLGQ